MKKVKKGVVAMLSVFLMFSLMFAIPVLAEESAGSDETITVSVKVPDDWIDPCLWAWSHPDGTNAFAEWPGEPLKKDGDWYTMEVPGWINSVIVNANEGSIQTGDMSVDSGKNLWIVVEDAEKYDFSYEEPATEVSSSNSDGGFPYVPVIVGICIIAVIIVVVFISKRKKKSGEES